MFLIIIGISSLIAIVVLITLCSSCGKAKVAAENDDNNATRDLNSNSPLVDNTTDIPQDVIPDVLPTYGSTEDGNSPQLVNSFVSNISTHHGPKSTTGWYINAAPVSFPSKETEKEKVLFEAVKAENKDLVRDIIKSGVNLNVMCSQSGTYLHYSIEHKLNEFAIMFLENGASYEINNYDRKSCIDVAIENQNVEILKYILEKYDVDPYYKKRIKESKEESISSLV